ncbi:hypothetical protein AAKU52_000176 [Pedobacter sp. CG_S7]|uniref:hypothetical protein n=1 Tax=Pedobacter sp. CG_S7 TaxID=3143930 RepID=UPI0033953FD1
MKVKIDYDGTNVHLSIEAETSKLAKLIMLLLNLIGIALIIIGILEWLLVLLIMGVLWVLFFGWLTLWNFFGREMITINTSSLSYQQYYGFYKTELEKKPVNRALNISLIPTLERQEKKYFQLIFETYNEFNLPEEIYRTSLPISETDLELLKKSIRMLYFKKVYPDYINMPYLLN